MDRLLEKMTNKHRDRETHRHTDEPCSPDYSVYYSLFSPKHFFSSSKLCQHWWQVTKRCFFCPHGTPWWFCDLTEDRRHVTNKNTMAVSPLTPIRTRPWRGHHSHLRSICCFVVLFIYFISVVFQLLPLLRFHVIYSSLRTMSVDSLWCVDLWQRPSLTFCCTEFTGQGLLWIPRVCWSWHRGHDWPCDPACRTPASQWRCLKCWSCSSPRLFECVRGARPGSAVPRGWVLHFHSPSVGLISHELFATSSLSLAMCVCLSEFMWTKFPETNGQTSPRASGGSDVMVCSR